jgi:cell division transport system permease protein
LGTWIRRHFYALGTSLRWLREQSVGVMLTVIVLAIALALPFALAMLLLNARADSAHLPPPLGLSVYLKPGVAEQKAKELAASTRERHDVASVTLITAAQALQDFRARSGLGAALDALGENPLPHVIEIVPAAGASSPTALEALRASVAAWPETDEVQLDRDWAQQLEALIDFGGQLLRVTVALLALGLFAIVGNTIRLEIQHRRGEIEIVRLIGGSNGFVRRPFLYLGVLYGLIAALVAWGIVAAAERALADPLTRLTAAYGQRLAVELPGPRELGILFGASLVLSWLGAAVAAARQLSRTAPPPR